MTFIRLKSKATLFIAGTYFSFAGTDDRVKGLIPVLTLCGELHTPTNALLYIIKY